MADLDTGSEQPGEHRGPAAGRHRCERGEPSTVTVPRVERRSGWWRRHLTAAGRRAERRGEQEAADARHAEALAAARVSADRWRHRAVLAEEALREEHAASLAQLLHASTRRAERDTYRGALSLACMLLVAVDAAVAELLRPSAPVLELPAGEQPDLDRAPVDVSAGEDLAAVG